MDSFRSFNCFQLILSSLKPGLQTELPNTRQLSISFCLLNPQSPRRSQTNTQPLPSHLPTLFFDNNYLEKGKHKDDVSCIQLRYSLMLSFLKRDVRVVHIFRNLRYSVGAWILETYPIRIWPRTLINWLISHTVQYICMGGKF